LYHASFPNQCVQVENEKKYVEHDINEKSYQISINLIISENPQYPTQADINGP